MGHPRGSRLSVPHKVKHAATLPQPSLRGIPQKKGLHENADGSILLAPLLAPKAGNCPCVSQQGAGQVNLGCPYHRVLLSDQKE